MRLHPPCQRTDLPTAVPTRRPLRPAASTGRRGPPSSATSARRIPHPRISHQLTTANGYSPTVIAPSKRRAMSTPIDAVRRPAASHLTSRRLAELGDELERQRCFRVSQLQDLAAAAAEPASSKDAARQQITHALTVAARSVLGRHRRRTGPAPDRDLRKLRALPGGNPIRTPGDLADGQALHALPIRHGNLPLRTTSHRWPRRQSRFASLGATSTYLPQTQTSALFSSRHCR
jgi:hypothetical protein